MEKKLELRTVLPTDILSSQQQTQQETSTGPTKQKSLEMDLSSETKSAKMMLEYISEHMPPCPAVKKVKGVVEGYLVWVELVQSQAETFAEEEEDKGGEEEDEWVWFKKGGHVGVRVKGEEVRVGRESEDMIRVAGEIVDLVEEIRQRKRYVRNQIEVLRLGRLRGQQHSNPQDRITKLQKYNTIKDVAQELVGLVAENRGVTLGHLYRSGEFGVGSED